MNTIEISYSPMYHLNARMQMKIVTVDGQVHKFPAAYQRKKIKAFRDAVLAAQQQAT